MAERSNSIFGTGVNRSTATEGKSIKDDYNQESTDPSQVLIGNFAGRTRSIKSAQGISLATIGKGSISLDQTIGGDVPLSAATDKIIQ